VVSIPAAVGDALVSQRAEALRQAMASVRVEGLEPTDAGKVIMGRWVDGELTHDQALDQILEHHRVR
jgi:hypothetical protein